MLGLLLLQVLVSCLCLGHSEVVPSSADCAQYFYEETPPNDILCPTNATWICQRYRNQYHFATLYDRGRRIPVYSAYIYNPGHGSRYDSWFIEPQLIDKKKYGKEMVEDGSISSDDKGQNQAIDKDYSDALMPVDRGHLCPSGHLYDQNSKWATFTLTNIVPQYMTLNQGAWRNYEETTMAEKTQGCNTTYVITGAVPGNTTITNGRVNIPSHIWSAACCLEGKKPIKAWGVIAENERNNNKNLTLLNLGELEWKLSGFYDRKDVTLFNSACPRDKA